MYIPNPHNDRLLELLRTALEELIVVQQGHRVEYDSPLDAVTALRTRSDMWLNYETITRSYSDT